MVWQSRCRNVRHLPTAATNSKTHNINDMLFLATTPVSYPLPLSLPAFPTRVRRAVIALTSPLRGRGRRRRARCVWVSRWVGCSRRWGRCGATCFCWRCVPPRASCSWTGWGARRSGCPHTQRGSAWSCGTPLGRADGGGPGKSFDADFSVWFYIPVVFLLSRGGKTMVMTPRQLVVVVAGWW